jgi:glycosyltransferase involved in cell wall biosynthesis
MKRILIIHHHLNPGGVTRVIESQVQALRMYKPDWEILILTASCQKPETIEKSGAKVILDQKLNYLSEHSDPFNEYRQVKQYFAEILKQGDILHIHNVNLGKNPVLTMVISELVTEGFSVVNHTHDFAEDRPSNMKYLKNAIASLSKKPLQSILYPDRPNLFYIVLNVSDKKRLLGYGIDKEKIFVLPNPVVLDSQNKNPDSVRNRVSVVEKLNLDKSKKIITYPVRVIRRKNIGEYILLCLLFKDVTEWLVTQPPRNPQEIRYYLEWKKFCSENKIPVIFEAGEHVNFESLISASDYCFTTSTMEGFGMVYLEPWLLGTPVIGRNLPKVTSDLVRTGIDFPLLYNSLEVPWRGSNTDFARLKMAEQMNFIKELIQNPQKNYDLFLLNSFLEKLIISVPQTLIDKNKAIILEEFSLKNYAKRLEEIYQRFTG